MDPATIIGIGGQLLGGLFGNRSAKKAAAAEAARAAQERAWAIEDQAQQFVRLRDAAEKAGFNPLTALGAAPASGMVGATAAAGPVSSQDYMGSAIADSALMLADSLAKTKAAAMGQKVQMLARQNRRISGQLTQATLRPKVGGVYDGASTFGTGAANAQNSSKSVPFVSPVEMGIDRGGDPVRPEEKHLFTTIHSNGASTNVPSPGVDPDEAAFGWLIDLNNRRKRNNWFENTNLARAGRAQRFAPRPTAQNNWNNNPAATSHWFWDTIQW